MKRHTMSRAFVVAAIALTLPGCGEPIDVAAPSDLSTSTTSATDTDPQTDTTVSNAPTVTSNPDEASDTTVGGTVPTTIPTTTIPKEEPVTTGEVPAPFVEAVLAHTAELAGTTMAELTVVEAAAHEWPDGSLGCPEPDQVYTQAITPGFQVLVAHGTDRYDYRINESGFFRLCTGQPLTPPDDNS